MHDFFWGVVFAVNQVFRIKCYHGVTQTGELRRRRYWDLQNPDRLLIQYVSGDKKPQEDPVPVVSPAPLYSPFAPFSDEVKRQFGAASRASTVSMGDTMLELASNRMCDGIALTGVAAKMQVLWPLSDCEVIFNRFVTYVQQDNIAMINMYAYALMKT